VIEAEKDDHRARLLDGRRERRGFDNRKGASVIDAIKNSVGVWAFGPAVTRFVPPGYHQEVAGEGMVEKTRRVAEGLSDVLDGLEYHYPGEVDEENVVGILGVLKDYGTDLPVIPAGLHPDPTCGKGWAWS